ncbi:drebrin-like protein A isoform X1 [Crotalus tigris]|uniref:drebrin-like protein A isoform X1 n=1 Tax=Crotalus tigris TaxID=88082 RepID=UPI00192F82C6|nr:drebrin-like protein A isoform X1 [Crotalus tigris]
MGSTAVDLEKHGLALLAAKSDVVNGRAAASWALFAYQNANELKLLDSGGGGPDELAKRFQSGRIMYGLCRLSEPTTGVPRVVLIHWVGEKVLDSRQEACAGHLPAIRAFFKEAHLVLKASRAEEVTQGGLTRQLSLVAPPEQPPPAASVPKEVLSRDPEELVGTNYRKTNPALEILHTKRSSFWAQAEREEEERRQEERRRAQEEKQRWEHLRMEEERREAAERERRVQERERLVQEQRKQQAQREAEEHRWEEARRREQARALAGTSPQSRASKTDPGVAGPGSHQPPRGFFQARERRHSSTSGETGPGVPRRPFLRHQRSLTESAYIFRRPPEPNVPGSFQASAAPPIGPKPSTVPHPASPPTSTLPGHGEAEAVPPLCAPPCLPPAAPSCALNGTPPEPASPPHLPPSPESEHSPGEERPLLTPLGPCSPPGEEFLPPSHAPEGQMSPSPAQGTNGRAMDWEELPSSTANSPPRAGLGETAPKKGASPGAAPGQAGAVHRGPEGERCPAGQGKRPNQEWPA